MTRARGITTAQAAELVGVTPAGFRSIMTQERARGVPDLRLSVDQWPDKRTPLWDEVRLRTWIKSRPGPGNWGPRPQA